MNITVIRLVIVATSIGFVVMCKILSVVVAFFLNACLNSTILGRDSLPLILIIMNRAMDTRFELQWKVVAEL